MYRKDNIRERNGHMLDHCPGAANLKTPTLTIRKCPQCGEDVELFSNDVSVKCSRCGFVIYNDIASCVQWCKHARECVGDEMYRKLNRKEGSL
jgi:ribosomal protein S27AE